MLLLVGIQVKPGYIKGTDQWDSKPRTVNKENQLLTSALEAA